MNGTWVVKVSYPLSLPSRKDLFVKLGFQLRRVPVPEPSLWAAQGWQSVVRQPTAERGD